MDKWTLGLATALAAVAGVAFYGARKDAATPQPAADTARATGSPFRGDDGMVVRSPFRGDDGMVVKPPQGDVQ